MKQPPLEVQKRINSFLRQGVDPATKGFGGHIALTNYSIGFNTKIQLATSQLPFNLKHVALKLITYTTSVQILLKVICVLHIYIPTQLFINKVTSEGSYILCNSACMRDDQFLNLHMASIGINLFCFYFSPIFLSGNSFF